MRCTWRRTRALGRKVAIKVLPAEFASDPERLARFEQEARAAAALNHPHIAAVFDVGTEDGTHFMVQEYLEGDTLREPLKLCRGRSARILARTTVERAPSLSHRGPVLTIPLRRTANNRK